MAALLHRLWLLAFLIPYATAQSATWLGQPLDNATVGITGLLILVTVPQLLITGMYLAKGRRPHLFPGIVMFVGVLFQLLAYILYLVRLVAIFSISSWSINMSLNQFNGIVISGVFFYEWADAVVVFGLACIIRDRYLAYQHRPKQFERTHLPLTIIMGLIGLACFLVIVQTAAYNGLVLQQPTEINNHLDFEHLIAYIRLENRVNDSVAAFKVVSALLLIPLGIWTKKMVGHDPILKVTLIGIIPLMTLRAIAYIAITVPVALLSDPDPSKSASLNASAAAFAAIAVPGLLFAIVIGVACSLFLKFSQWLQPSQGVQELDDLPSPLQPSHPYTTS